mgnify:CR=1 FL=1
MPFFQNPFGADFFGVWLLGDRQHSVDFKCPRNAGRGDESVVAHNTAPYNLSGNDADGNAKNVFKLAFAYRSEKSFNDLNITISASSLAATTAQEVVTSLTADSTFNTFFTATVKDDLKTGTKSVLIKQNRPVVEFKFYVKSKQAETVLNFNKYAGVAELPGFFARHTIANGLVDTDSQGMLIALDASVLTDASVINNAYDEHFKLKGFSSSVVRADYALLRGRSGIFTFQKNTVDGSSRITQTIEYPAGALPGDMAKKTIYSYTAAQTAPDKKVEIPYTLESGDLVTP